ncbi:MAG: hypothetical protein KKB70_01195, partial [Proteobacteria bacterium]|nr:hypothetical protein [Pseudomonadota bacterium]
MIEFTTTRADLPGRLMAALPLVAAYLLLPMYQVGIRFVSQDSTLGEVLRSIPDASVWEALAGFALLWLAWKTIRPASGFRGIPVVETLFALGTACLFLAALHVWAGPRAYLADFWLRWLVEGAPLVYLLFAGLWCLTFGLPSRRAFRLCGGVLAALVLADFLTAFLTLGLSRLPVEAFLPMNREVLACLLGVALCAGMPEGRREPGSTRLSALDALLILGLAVTFSRTALFAAACVWLFLGSGSLFSRAVAAFLFLGCAAFSILLAAPLGVDTVNLDGHLLWMAGVQRYMDRPETLLLALGLGPFTLSLPAVVATSLGIPAKTYLLYPEQIHSLWLRLSLVWSGLGAGVFLLLIMVPTMLRPSRFAAGVIALILAQGTI